MAYQIRRLDRLAPDSFPLYFLDSNVWIYHLLPRKALQPFEVPYAEFVDQVIGLHGIGHPVEPKFVWTSTLLSEVVNAGLRIAYKTYCDLLPVHQQKGFEYKKHYRPSQAFRSALNILRSDLQGYEPYIEVFDDGFKTDLDVFGDLLPRVSPAADFTDLLYARQMKARGIPVVTNDRDFAFRDLQIITSHPRLLRLR
jgi:predicted nucleic acid-binding protein